MPGPAVHHIVANEVKNSLGLELNDPELAALYLGAQGPDFLFFNTRDIHPALRKLVDYYLEITDFMEEVKERILAIIPQELIDAIDALAEVYDDIQNHSSTLTEVQQLLGDAQGLIDALTADITAKLEQHVLVNFDLFNLLKNPIHDGQPFNEWWWFDTLHYRRTGLFTGKLLNNSGGSPINRAYAIGYMTHYAADIVGHPYVNIIAGGPYRTHAQRHKLIENYQDSYYYNFCYPEEELVTSKLADKYLFPEDPDMPDSLADFILQEIKAVYFENGNPLYGNSITKDDIKDAYRVWHIWFTKATNAAKLKTPEPYSLTAELQEAWDQFVENMGDIGDLVSDPAQGEEGILGVLKALATFAIAPFLVAAAIIDYVLGNITTLGAAPVRYFISLAYEQLYNAYLNLHQAVVLSGFGFPFNSELSYWMVKHVLYASLQDVGGHNAASLISVYPTKKFKLVGLECESHLIYPIPGVAETEKDKCGGAPNAYYKGCHVDDFVKSSLVFNQEMYNYYKSFIEKAGEDNEADTVGKFAQFRQNSQLDSFGNAVEFSRKLYADFQAGIPFADFNMDADRGIGFKPWRKVESFDKVNVEDPSLMIPVEGDGNVPSNLTDIIDPSEVIL